MSDSDDQAAKKKQNIKDFQSAGFSKMSNTLAQRMLYETQSTDSNQSTRTTQEICDVIIETHNDQDTSNRRHIVPVRVDNKAAERSRLYRERHREEINQRRKRQRQQNLHEIHTVSNVQNTDEIEQITQATSNSELSSNSHTTREQRYYEYERHKEKINKRRRDNRRKQNISRSIPATAAERSRNYRERKRQEINERRKDSRLRQQNVIHTESNTNNIDAIEEITEATPNDQQSLNSSNDDIVQEIAQNFASTPQQHNTRHFEDTQNDRVQTTTAALQTTEDSAADSQSHTWAATMKHGASQRTEEQSPVRVTVKTEMEESRQAAEYIEIEVNLNCCKEEPELGQDAVPEITFSVKEEIPDYSLQVSDIDNQGPHTPNIIESVNTAPDIPGRCIVFNIKKEMPDTEFGFKPALHGHDYTSNQNMSVAIEENVIAADGNHLIMSNRVKEESVEDKCKDAQRSQEETQPQQRAQYRLYVCDSCPKTYSYKSALNAHCRRVHGTESYECTECNLKYKCKEYLARHVRNVHYKRQSQCTVCNKMCQSKEAMRCHVAKYHRGVPAVSQPGAYICDYCQKICTSKTRIQDHISCVHAEGSYKCRQCNKRFKCERYLTTHITNVHAGRRQACNVCGKSVKSNHLRQHMHYMHSDKKLQCKHCGKTMKSKYNLRQHLNELHGQQSAGSESRVYICDYCQRTFKAKYSIEIHVASLHGSRSYKCSQCDKCFKCKQYLTIHTVNVHTGRRQVCNVCGKSLKMGGLRQHMRKMHSDEQVQCTLCGATVKSMQYLRQHMMSRHGQQCAETHQQSTCSKVEKGFKSKRSRQQLDRSGECTRPTPTVSDLQAVVSTSTQQHNTVVVKKEPADGDLEVGPVVLQHMDCNYRPCKQEPPSD